MTPRNALAALLLFGLLILGGVAAAAQDTDPTAMPAVTVEVDYAGETYVIDPTRAPAVMGVVLRRTEFTGGASLEIALFVRDPNGAWRAAGIVAGPALADLADVGPDDVLVLTRVEGGDE